LDIFLNSLTEDSIDRVISCFQAAIDSRSQHLPSDFDPIKAQKTCDHILSLTEDSSVALDVVHQLPKCWVNLNGLGLQSNLTTLESCITRVFCIKSALTLHHWLLKVVPAAIKHVEDNSKVTWIDNLVWDVQMAINQKKSKEFASNDYLPNLGHHSSFQFRSNKFRFEQTEILTLTVSSIIRVWLNFPSDDISLVQLSIINILTAKSPPSIMFLEEVWKTYSTPFKVKRSKSEIEKKLNDFDKKYTSHPFSMPESLEYKKLQHLDQLTHNWMNKKTRANRKDMVCQVIILKIISNRFSFLSKDVQKETGLYKVSVNTSLPLVSSTL
jgi:hypothetical protein